MSLIPQPFIDDLLTRLDIVDIIDKRVKLKKIGKNYSACCPFHNEKTPSFTVSQDKQFYYCFGCGATGNAVGFLMEYDKLGFVDAVEQLAHSAGIQVPREERKDKDRQQADFKPLYSLLDECNKFYQQQLKEHADRYKAVKYLQERGLSGHISQSFGLGYAPPGWDNLLATLGTDKSRQTALVTTGMVIESDDNQKRYDRFRSRIMFPILDIRGRCIGFGGRVLGEENRVGPDGKKAKGSGPKYLNSPETPVFHKGRELYGLYQARHANREIKQLVVVEGYMDVIALAQFGINNAVATLGTACGEDHLNLAFKYTSTIAFCFDGDNAGRAAAKRALENALPVMTDGRQIKFLFLPEGQDPDSMVRNIGPERFTELLQKGTPLEEFFFDALSEDINATTMEGRARLSKLAAPLLHKLPKGVYRELMFDLLAKRTGLSQDILQELISEPAPKLAPEAMKPAPSAPHPEHTLPADEFPPFDHYTPPPEDYPFGGEPEFSSHFPEQHSLRAEPRKQRSTFAMTPTRLATALLFNKPELAHTIGEHELPEGEENERLEQLIHYLKQRESPSIGNIIGYWLGCFGTDSREELTGLIANQLLAHARRGDYNEQKELHDALTNLQQQKLEQQRREAISALKAKPPHTLSHEERTQLLALLQQGKKAAAPPTTH